MWMIGLEWRRPLSKIDHLINIPWKPLGRDWSGVDCWGLIRLAYLDLFDIHLPKYDGISPDDHSMVADMMEVGKKEWMEVDSPSFGDVLLFFIEIPKWPTHCAMAVDAIHMLNIRKGQSSGVDLYDNSFRGQLWRLRLTGIYRHVVRIG